MLKILGLVIAALLFASSTSARIERGDVLLKKRQIFASATAIPTSSIGVNGNSGGTVSVPITGSASTVDVSTPNPSTPNPSTPNPTPNPSTPNPSTPNPSTPDPQTATGSGVSATPGRSTATSPPVSTTHQKKKRKRVYGKKNKGGPGGRPAGGCWLQLRNGQWVWNDRVIYDQCGGWIQLPNFEWLWTEYPHLYPHIQWLPGGRSRGGPSPIEIGGGDSESDSGSEGDSNGGSEGASEGDSDYNDTEDSGTDDGEYSGDDNSTSGDDANSPGDGGGAVIGDTCTCGAWSFPGDCEAQTNQRFRWRLCTPRYCAVEDEYVPCGEATSSSPYYTT